MNKEKQEKLLDLLKDIDKLFQENRNLKFLNKVLITGIKRLHDDIFGVLPVCERMAYQDECKAILRTVKMFEYKFNGAKSTEIIDKAMSLTDEELFYVDE